MPELYNNKGTKPIVHQVYAVTVIYPNDQKYIDNIEVKVEKRTILKAVNHSKPNHNQTEEIELISNIKSDINQTCTDVLKHPKKSTDENVVIFQTRIFYRSDWKNRNRIKWFKD